MRRTVAAVLVAAVTAALFAATPTGAASRFRFFGSGFGHGIGMSQWGAYGMAKQGWSAERILRHFYQGTRVRSDVSYPRRVRVGLAWGLGKVHLTAKEGRVRLSLGGPHGTLVGEIRRGDTWTVRSGAGAYVVLDDGGNRVGGRTWGSASEDLVATYERSGARLQIPEASDGPGAYSYVRGHVEIDLYSCTDRCRVRVILPVRLEEYLYGLSEVPSSWPVATLRAQAIAGRTYAAYILRRFDRRGYCDCDITDGTNDQVYAGAAKELGPGGDRWVGAVDDTSGRVIVYDGNLIQAFYAASDGGHSENVEDAWHGGNRAYAIPWLTGVCDPGEDTSANPWTDWSKSFSASEVTSRLRAYTGGIGTVTGFGNIRRGVSGRIVTVVVRGERGQATISGPQLRAGLGLWDDRVWINSDRNITGAIRSLYDAQMCRPGLPTSKTVDLGHGSRMSFDVGVIYRNDRATVTVWLKGAILSEYQGVGGPKGRLGLPTTKVREPAVAGGGRCNRCGRIAFEGGRVYWKDGVGAFALWNPILRAYLDAGGPSALGYPTSRPSRTGDGGWTATFEGGTITCPSGGGCRVS
jgi:SpoIID/LytB domain protein